MSLEDDEDEALSDLVDACDVLVKTHYGDPEPRYGIGEAVRDLRRAFARFDLAHPPEEMALVTGLRAALAEYDLQNPDRRRT